MENKTVINTNINLEVKKEVETNNTTKPQNSHNNPYGNPYGLSGTTDTKSKEFRAMAYELIGYKVDLTASSSKNKKPIAAVNHPSIANPTNNALIK